MDVPTFFMTFFVIHLTTAVVCVVVARNRGRSNKLWFLYGLAFQVAALFVLLYMPSLKE